MDGLIEFYPQYLNNPETVSSTVESEHDKTNTLIYRSSEFNYQPGHPQSESVGRKWLTVKRTTETAGLGNSVGCVVRLVFRR